VTVRLAGDLGEVGELEEHLRDVLVGRGSIIIDDVRGSMIVLVMVAAACGGAVRRPTPQPGVVASNVLRADYAGSTECSYCHAGIYDKWKSSPMRNMTRVIDGADVQAPFDGETFDFKGDALTMTSKDGARFMHLVGKDGRDELYRLTRVIGGRTREDFVGKLEGKPDAEEIIMPASWVFPTKSWRYKGYSVMEPERPSMHAGPTWRETCLFCHNTAPYLSRVLGKLFGDGAPGYAGGIQDQFLPADRLPSFAVTDGDRLDGELDQEIRFLGFKPPPDAGKALIKDAINATRQRFGAAQLVEVGIGCEACHGGSKAHADDPRLRPTFAVKSDAFAVTSPSGPMTPAEEINRTCARCHTVLFSGYEDTWEGGKREVGKAGGSGINSGEGRDFLLGGCWKQMACSDCHDPHARDAPDHYASLEKDAGSCTRCHKDKDYGASHSHHQTVGCIDCHMPRKNTGLDYRLTRYHRIGSPDDAERVENDRPLECALCHADRSVASLTSDIERWWGRSYDAKKLTDLYGSLDANVLVATLERGKAHEQAAAMGAAGDAKLKAAEDAIVQQLVNPFPLLRGYARKALEQIEGRELKIDLDAPAADILAAAASWRSATH
jgi:hypothetical protein